MPKPMIKIHNTETNEIIEREMTTAEYASYQETLSAIEARNAELATKAAAKQAVLDKLNLTAEELAAALS